MAVTVSLSESDYKFVQILKDRDDASTDGEVLQKCLIDAIDPNEAEIIAEIMGQANEPDEPINEETMEGIRRRLEDVKQGRYRPLDEISKEMGI